MRRAGALRLFALLSVIANCAIVVTGGAVRLSGSGLGCPTWPSCTDDSLTPVAEYAWHGAVEFGNRMLTFVVAVIAIVTLLLALAQRVQRRLALVAFLGIPAQAVLGGITVLTGLNPWTVAAHFLLSMAIIAVTMVLLRRVRIATGAAEPPVERAAPPVRWLAGVTVALAAATLVVGTIVTGSGPHAGDQGAKHRIGFDPGAVSQLHADLVMVLVGLAVGLVVTLRLTRAPRGARLAGWWLVAAIAVQGVIGYTQYFLGVPAVLVVFHMAGACAVWVAVLAVPLQLGGRRAGVRPAPAGASRSSVPAA
ncbi:COX15/CtaA family protein [Jatrophihabitans sp. YIM 134969]